MVLSQFKLLIKDGHVISSLVLTKELTELSDDSSNINVNIIEL